jgi:hypothetical protein
MSTLVRISVGLTILAVAGCAGTPPSEVSPSPDGSPPITAEPSPSAAPSADPTDNPSPMPTDGENSPAPGAPTPSPAVRPTPSFAPTAAPGGTAWTNPERISERSYYEPSMIVDGGLTDIVHVAAGLGRGIFHVTNDAGNVAGAWTRERLSNPPQRNSDEQPSLALDPVEGDLYVAFTRMYDSELGRFPEGIYLARRPYGGDWTAPTLLVGGGAHSPSLQVRDGRLYLAYVESSPTDIVEDDPRHPLMYGTDPGGNFSAEEVARNGAHPQLLLDDEGRPHILFGSPFWADVGVSYARGAAPAGSFTVERLPGTTGEERLPALALDASNRPHAVWNLWPDGAPRPSIYYARRGGGGWSSPQVVLEDALAARVAVDDRGTVHVAAGGERGVWYARDGSGGFSGARLSSEPTLWLDMVEPDGDGSSPQLHLLFVGGSDEVGNGLWYAVGRPD